ncbi:RNase adapter RapZ [Oceanithermus sp.]|uniref:RNase adapter RapZ n=1 Tax=Oceanithermus sp. TaxID=2268145 RepID=UPI00257A2ED6|nr:RNase adapter RapZ [Oceanithermus sp.]
MRVVVISGLSGAGKSTALAHLEDLGYFAVDNLPPALWAELVPTLEAAGVQRVALGIDVRARAFLDAAPAAIDALAGAGAGPVLVFLEARPEVLLARYNLTRRAHPLRGGHLLREIEAERRLLAPLRGRADWILDTSETGPGELGERLAQLLGEERPFVLRLISFGYKWGPPQVADLLLDVRALPNPHWDEALRPRSGTDPEVAAYVFTAEAEPYYRALRETAARAAAAARAAGRSGYTVAVGCTGGRHRSVAVVERLARELGEDFEVEREHRDVGKEG